MACCLALWSSYKNKVISPQTIAFGEVGLLGEVRPWGGRRRGELKRQNGWAIEEILPREIFTCQPRR